LFPRPLNSVSKANGFQVLPRLNEVPRLHVLAGPGGHDLRHNRACQEWNRVVASHNQSPRHHYHRGSASLASGHDSGHNLRPEPTEGQVHLLHKSATDQCQRQGQAGLL